MTGQLDRRLWSPSSFLIAIKSGTLEVSGYVYRGLGLHIQSQKRGKSPPIWNLTHLGSGHAVCSIRGSVRTAFSIATKISESSDWDFDGIAGWKNRDPDLAIKTLAVINEHPKICRRTGGTSDDEIARAIVLRRADG